MADIYNIPHFLKAKTPIKLQKLMLQNNIKYSTEHVYSDIQLASDGHWYTWFYKNLKANSLTGSKK